MSELVVKSNEVVNASYHLTLNEQRLILSAVALIPKNQEVSAQVIYFVNAQHFVELGVHPKTAYRELKEATSRLYERSINIKMPKGLLKTRWVKQVFIASKEEGETNNNDTLMVGVKFVEEIIPFLSNLSKNFTEYQLKDISGFSSSYSIRFYEMIMQFKSTGYRIMTITELKKLLDLGKSYTLVADLKRRVIDVAVKEINEKSPYIIRYNFKKTGRKITHLELKFELKDKGKSIDIDRTNKNTTVRDPNTIDWVNGQTDNETKKAPSWQTKGLSDAQIKKLSVHTKDFVDANSSKISPTDRREYPEIFESWRPMLKDPSTVNSFKQVQELLDSQRAS